MLAEPDQPTEHFWQQRKANRHVQRMDVHEGLAEQAERTTEPTLMTVFAARYRQLIGVDPTRRQELRDALGALHGASVEEILQRFAQ